MKQNVIFRNLFIGTNLLTCPPWSN